MKYLLLLLGTVTLPFALRAQTEVTTPITNAVAPVNAAVTEAPAKTNFLMRAATEIFSDRGEFNMKSEPFVAIYTGHVRVIDPQMKLTCDVLTATLPKSGGHVDRIVAERNVVIDAADTHGEPVHATCDRATYTFKVENAVTNELIELSGDPRIETKTRSVTGEPIIWDRLNNSFYGTNLHMTGILSQSQPKVASTNQPATSLNQTNMP
jgi:lipopolysaccharide export system protein LptA